MTCIKEAVETLSHTTIIEDVPPRINLASSEDIRREMAKVYRESRSGKLMASDATRLVYMLTQILKAYELCVLEKKLAALEMTKFGGVK